MSHKPLITFVISVLIVYIFSIMKTNTDHSLCQALLKHLHVLSYQLYETGIIIIIIIISLIICIMENLGHLNVSKVKEQAGVQLEFGTHAVRLQSPMIITSAYLTLLLNLFGLVY